MVRYGILGFGHHAIKRLVPGFAGAENAQLAGLWRRNQEKAKANAAEFSIPHLFETPEALCASPEIDAVFRYVCGGGALAAAESVTGPLD